MGLESGKYFIFSVTHGAPVGRNPDVEDRSLLPFAVYMLPNSVQPPVWDVEKLPNGNYRLQTRDALIGALEGHVVVFLENGNLPLDTIEWSIVQRAGSDTDPDEGAFFITVPDHPEGRGWVVDSFETGGPSEDGAKIVVQSFTVDEPPFHPPNEVFIFKKASDDDD